MESHGWKVLQANPLPVQKSLWEIVSLKWLGSFQGWEAHYLHKAVLSIAGQLGPQEITTSFFF